MQDFIKDIIRQPFKVREGIVCLEREDVGTRFSKETQENLFEIEDGSWWFQFRAMMLERLAQEYMDKSRIIFDVGGGNGYTAFYYIRNGWNTALIEPSWTACRNAKRRGIDKVICGIVNDKNIQDQCLPQIMLLDVLEHIEDDMDFLKLLYKKLCNGGKLMVTVPALEHLWSSEDKAAGHFRRYDKQLLEELAIKAGFSVIYSNYFFGFLVVPIWLVRHVGEKIGLIKPYQNRNKEERKKIMNSEFKQKQGIIGIALHGFEKRELKKIMSKKEIKRGSSIVCILEKI